MAEKLLTIAIPTYRRASFLKESLSLLYKEWKSLDDNSDIEILVSNNDSPDETDLVVKGFIADGFPIKYFCNQTNIGADANIAQCFEKADGRFAWVLGDDDFVKEGSLRIVVDYLRLNTDTGVVYLRCGWIGRRPLVDVYDNPEKGLSEIGVALTLISANIVNKTLIDTSNKDYVDTRLSQVAYFLDAGKKSGKVAIINRNCLIVGVDNANAGGYNQVKVVVVNFLAIWKVFCKSRWYYEIAKYNVFRHYIVHNLKHYIFGKKDERFDNGDALKILFKYYWPYPYFYMFLAITPFHSLVAKAFRLVRGQKV